MEVRIPNRKSRPIALLALSAALAISLASFAGIKQAQANDGLETASIATTQSTSALDAAKSLFRIADENVIEAGANKAINEWLKDAQNMVGTTSSPSIVHVNSGPFSISGRIIIPSNVILVSEPGVQYTWSGSTNDAMVMISGSIYGGVFNGGAKATSVLRFAASDFSGVNGIIRNAKATNGAKNGVCVREPGCKNAQIIGCTVTGNYENGITIEKDAECLLIDSTNSSDNGHGKGSNANGSGINISHSNVGTISNCTLNNNKDKGVSTNSDPMSYTTGKPGCAIGAITNCTITNNVINGVYLKPMCHVDSFTNNKVTGNGDGLVCAGKTARGTTGNSYAKNVVGNTFSGNTNGQVAAQDKGALIELGANNIITSGKDSGVLAMRKGIVKILGDSNVISSNKKAGISVSAGGQLTISGNQTKIQKNATQAIYCNAGKVTISGSKTQISGNKKMGIAGYAKSTLVISGTNTALSSNKSTGMYVTGKSNLKISGKGISVSKCTDMGLSARNASITITGTNFSIASSKNAGIGLYDKAKLTMRGKKAVIKKNGTFGIYAKNKSKATVKYAKFTSNKKGAYYATGGAKVKIG